MKFLSPGWAEISREELPLLLRDSSFVSVACYGLTIAMGEVGMRRGVHYILEGLSLKERLKARVV